jgi:hypothetical protein
MRALYICIIVRTGVDVPAGIPTELCGERGADRELVQAGALPTLHLAGRNSAHYNLFLAPASRLLRDLRRTCRQHDVLIYCNQKNRFCKIQRQE